MLGKIMIPMYRLWLHAIQERHLNLVTHSVLSILTLDLRPKGCCRHLRLSIYMYSFLITQSVYQIYPTNLQGSYGWELGSFSKVVVTFNHVGRSFNLLTTTTGDVWTIPSFWFWDYVLHVSCVVTNCGQHQWFIAPPLNSSLGLTGGKHSQKISILFFRLMSCSSKILLSQVAFLSLYFFLSLSFLLTVSVGWGHLQSCGRVL